MLVWKNEQFSQMASKAQSSSVGSGAVAVAEESVVLAAQAGHLGSDGVCGERFGGGVEGVDLVGDGEVLIGDGAVGDLGVAQCHVHAAVAQHRCDRLQAHAAVDRLGGQGVAQLVGMDVRQSGGGAGLVDEPGDGVPVQGSPVLPWQQQPVPGRNVGGAVVVDQRHQLGMQGQVAVLAELADRDVQPGSGTDLDHRVSGGRAVNSLTLSPVRSSTSTVTRISIRDSA